MVNESTFWIASSVVLLLIVIGLIGYIIAMKRIVRGIKKELPMTRDIDYNKQINVTLLDKDLSDMATEINKNLDFQKALKRESIQNEEKLKDSIADIAHDLRTPLTVIKGNLQMLEKTTELTDEGKGYLEICNSKADYIKEVIDDFFELSVLESDNEEVILDRIDMTEAVVQFVMEHEAVINDRKLTPDILIPEKSLFVKGNIGYINRMMSNLLNNIMKYAKDSFSIILREENDNCVLAFSNEITEEIDVRNIFDRCYQGDKSRNKSGAGLGLYIVKLLADKQNINVRAEVEDSILSIFLDLKIEK